MAKYVGFKQGNVHESHVISEYYCGGCGWPVTDHDSFCPECGGAFRECDASNLEDENAKLREDNDRLIQAIEDLHNVSLEDELVRLENENAKLREICEDCAIELYVNGNVTDAATENLFNDMRELGMKVGKK